jgi:hypothetical protein
MDLYFKNIEMCLEIGYYPFKSSLRKLNLKEHDFILIYNYWPHFCHQKRVFEMVEVRNFDKT